MDAPQTRITHVRDLDDVFDRRQNHARRAVRGHEVRLARGAYVDSAEWQSLGSLNKYCLRVRAVAEGRANSGLVLSHWSAAALHGLPILGAWPDRVHAIVGKTAGGRSDKTVAKHAMAIPGEDIVVVGGLLVTSVARTVLDMAVAADFLTAVMVADRALLIDRFDRFRPLVTREDLGAAWHRALPFRGHHRARQVIDFGATQSESPLESVSRANMRIVGCPPPELQHRFSDSAGLIAWSDFYWEDLNLAGEADGKAKYLDRAVRGSKSAEQVVFEEKQREDRVRATGTRFTRWPWSTGVNPTLLRAHLLRAGLRMTK